MGPMEYGVNRPGEDFDSFPSGGWQQCSTSCGTNDRCWAYTYVKPRGQAKRGTCWVKDGNTKAKKDSCCVSGIKVMGPYEPGVDRPGHNLRDGYPTKLSSSCRRDCQQDPNCWAWTFVKAGVQGSEAMSSSPKATAHAGSRAAAQKRPPIAVASQVCGLLRRRRTDLAEPAGGQSERPPRGPAESPSGLRPPRGQAASRRALHRSPRGLRPPRGQVASRRALHLSRSGLRHPGGQVASRRVLHRSPRALPTMPRRRIHSAGPFVTTRRGTRSILRWPSAVYPER